MKSTSAAMGAGIFFLVIGALGLALEQGMTAGLAQGGMPAGGMNGMGMMQGMGMMGGHLIKSFSGAPL